MTADVHATVARRLRRGGQRYTDGRRRLVGLLARADGPLTIPEILERAADLAQSSVYRNLRVLEGVGVVHRIVTVRAEGARFELAEDLTTHHHHLICRRCGTVRDFRPSAAVEDALSRLTERADVDGFDAEHHRLDLVGRCEQCA